MSAPGAITFDGVLLAAGRSRRMGTDKALLRMPEGCSLWERQERRLKEAGVGQCWISARPEQSWVPPGATRVVDERADEGPLGGILAAWRRSEASHLLVLAVDLPELPTAWWHRLSARAAAGIGVAGRHDSGVFEPLAACYPRSWLTSWERAAGEGRLGVQALVREALALERLHVEPIGPAEAGWFRNVNTPDDTRRVP